MVMSNTVTVPSDGVSYYFLFSNVSSTLVDVSVVLPVGGVGFGYAGLGGTGLATIKYLVANLICSVTPAPGVGSGWNFCLTKGAAGLCSNLGGLIYNSTSGADQDSTHVDTIGSVQPIAIKFEPVGSPLPITKAACGFEIRDTPLFLP